MHCEMIHIGSYTFVGNNTCIVGNAFVSDDVVVGSMTLLDAEVYPPGATLVGSPCISLGLRPPVMEAPDHVGRVGRVMLDWFFLLSFAVVLSASLAPPIVFLHWLSSRVHPLVLAALFPPIFSWFFIAVLLFAVVFKWIFVRRLDTNPHHAASFQRQCLFFVKVLLALLGLSMLQYYFFSLLLLLILFNSRSSHLRYKYNTVLPTFAWCKDRKAFVYKHPLR
jgi:hypothetical protein